LIELLKESCGESFIIAEDLGLLTNEVRELLALSKLPGMKVLQFAFDPGEESAYLPHKYEGGCVCYTGTHDNATLSQWLSCSPPEVLAKARDYLGIASNDDLGAALLKAGFASRADIFIAQLQDYLGLGAEARTNIPGTLGGNWSWRLKKGWNGGSLASSIAELTAQYGRA
ncbi:MAG: 4-alpha-glucanotransferase, partial [Oscillospiraceae bacterium]|nr:4-alpha-glucanotransferase [Oscillospiraceae bacterium]